MKMLRERILKVVTVLFIGSVFLLVGAAPASAQQDLVVRILKCPTSAKAGQELNAGFQVDAINGGRTAVKDVAVDIVLKKDVSCPVPAPYAVYSPNYSNGVLLKGGREYVSLNSGQLLNVKLNGTNTIPTDTPAGVYYLCAVIDAGNKIKEVNEPNNCACCPVKISAGAAKQGTTASASVTTSTAVTPSKGVTPSVGIAGKSSTAAQKVAKQQFTMVKVSEAELNNFKIQKSTVSASEYKIGGHSTSGRKIVVSAPKDGDVWEADKEYNITWESTGISGDVKIALAASQYDLKPITERTANTGAYRFRVPRNLVGDFRGWRVRVSTLDGTVYGWSPPYFSLYTQDIDLQCMIYDPKFGWREQWLDSDEEWLQFNVRIRNDGIRFPISIDTVLVQIIKEPEEIVCYQEEWGFGRIYPHEWYQLPEPRKFRIAEWPRGRYGPKTVNLKSGAYRVEVWLDPQNRLGELEGLRQNNKAVMKWIIK